MSQPSERLKILIDAVAEGDRAAVELIYRLTCDKLFGVVLRIVRQPKLAEQALVESYLRVWQDALAYDSKLMDPAAWLVMVARKVAFDILRREEEISQGEAIERPEPAADEAEAAAAQEISGELKNLLACLAKLPEDLRHMVLLVYYDGWSLEELAAEFEAPASVIRTWLLRGLDGIRECARL